MMVCETATWRIRWGLQQKWAVSDSNTYRPTDMSMLSVQSSVSLSECIPLHDISNQLTVIGHFTVKVTSERTCLTCCIYKKLPE
jgi:hypothetical protein